MASQPVSRCITCMLGWLRQVSGIFVDKAMDLIPSPAWSDQQMEEFFEATINTALKFGLTSIHDADTRLSMISFFKKSVAIKFLFQGESYFWQKSRRGRNPCGSSLKYRTFFLFLKTLIAAPLSNGWCCVAKEWLRVGNRKLHQWGMGSWRPSFYQLRKTGAAHVAGREVVCGW